MGRGDNRRTRKMRRKKAQTKLKVRIARQIEAGKQAGPDARKARKSGGAAKATTVTRRPTESE